MGVYIFLCVYVLLCSYVVCLPPCTLLPWVPTCLCGNFEEPNPLVGCVCCPEGVGGAPRPPHVPLSTSLPSSLTTPRI